MPMYDLPFPINDVRNGLLWAKSIEKAFSSFQACIVYNPLIQKLIFLVVDASIMNEPLHVKKRHFKDVHSKPLNIPRDKFPSLRLLLSHASCAIDHATKSNWELSGNIELWKTNLDMMNTALHNGLRVGDGSESSEAGGKGGRGGNGGGGGGGGGGRGGEGKEEEWQKGKEGVSV